LELCLVDIEPKTDYTGHEIISGELVLYQDPADFIGSYINVVGPFYAGEQMQGAEKITNSQRRAL